MKKLLTTRIEDLLIPVLKTISPGGAEGGRPQVQFTRDHRLGDLQTNAAMTQAKALGKNPRELAAQIIEALGPGGRFPAPLESAEAAGPGFINFRLTPQAALELLAGAVEEGDGREGPVILIDYSSPNIAKRMHIGHLRSTILGDSLKRIFRYLGFRVIGDNHLGDWGTQFGKLITAYRLWLDEGAYRENPIEELERLYVKFEKESGKSEGLLEEARRELKKLQDGDPENRALWKQYVDLSLEEYDKIYRRLGVSFDTCRGESYYHDRMSGVVKELTEKGLARQSEGALVVFFDDEKLHPCLVQKNDGAYLYATSDLACLQSREEEYAPERIIYVTDDRQIPHFQQVFRIAALLGWKGRPVHVPFGVMKFMEGHFSSRLGNVIYLSQLLDEAEKRAYQIVDEKNPALGGDEKKEVARAVGLGAVKYFDLSQNRSSDIIFDWDKVLSFDGNTAPYLQYVYARIASLLRKAGDGPENPPTVPPEGPEEGEKKLIHLMLQFPQAVFQGAESYRPNLISDYLFDLSQAFNYFYNAFPILKALGEQRDFRLFLCRQTGRIIKTGLNLLGIETLERM